MDRVRDGVPRGRLLVIMQRQVLQSCSVPLPRRRGGASASKGFAAFFAVRPDGRDCPFFSTHRCE